MVLFRKDSSLAQKNFPIGIVEVQYPDLDQLLAQDFRRLVAQELNVLRRRFAEYDRKTVFGDNPYVRFFKKFKKTYPVLLQFESVLLKGRPFPEINPVAEVPFLMELTTQVLSGTHDLDQIRGDVELYLETEKTSFPGMRGSDIHTYPGDFCGRDEEGIIFSLIAGADARTCCRPESRHVLYPLFGTPELPVSVIQEAMEVLIRYIRVLSPSAQINTKII